MQKAFFYGLWLIVALFLTSVSNYFLNKAVYVVDYTVMMIVVANVCVVLLGVFAASFVKQRNSILATTFLSLAFFLLLFITASEFLIYKYSGVAFEEQSFLHFELHSLLVGFSIYPVKYTAVVLTLGLMGFLLVQLSSSIETNRYSVLVLVLAVTLLVFNAYGNSVGRLIVNYNTFISSQHLEKISAADIEPLKPFGIQHVPFDADFFHASVSGKKKNLIVIYLESFSRGFATNDRYPGLTPNIKQLIDEHGELSNYWSTAKFTMQGMISSMCGLMPKLLARNNISTDNLPYENLPCLPDVLSRLGYHQEFIGGARKAFSNKEAFLKSKQFDAVYGWTDYQKPAEYRTNDWGLQDSDLFKFAAEKIRQLHDSEQPFQVSLLTLGTHLDGNPDPSCPKYNEDMVHHKFIEGIHCTDYLLGNFIQDLKGHGVLEDTAIMITSDHGVFPVQLIKDLFGSGFKRNQLLGILIDDYHFDTNLPFGLYDMPAILLRALGIESNVSFINGRFPEEVSPERYLLRESVLIDGLKKEGTCHADQEIELPIDFCENQRLMESSWRYAANFNKKTEPLNLEHSIEFKTVQEGKRNKVELILDGQNQSELFLSEGYPVHDAHRKYRNHIYVLVYDIKNKAVESRNAFRYLAPHVDYFHRLMAKVKDEERLYFIFTEQGVDTPEIPVWKEVLSESGAYQFDYPSKPYFAVFRTSKNKIEVAEFTGESKAGINVVFEGINEIPFKEVSEAVLSPLL